jgi:hypothetical protein
MFLGLMRRWLVNRAGVLDQLGGGPPPESGQLGFPTDFSSKASPTLACLSTVVTIPMGHELLTVTTGTVQPGEMGG